MIFQFNSFHKEKKKSKTNFIHIIKIKLFSKNNSLTKYSIMMIFINLNQRIKCLINQNLIKVLSKKVNQDTFFQQIKN